MRRMKRPAMSGVLCALVFIAATSPLFAARPKVMTNADVIDLAEAGVSEWNIISIVLMRKTDFSMTRSDVAALKSAGVTEPVIKAMTLQASEPPLFASEPATLQPSRAPRKASKSSSGVTRTGVPTTLDADEERRRIEEFEAQERARATTPVRARAGDSSSERERQTIEQFEAEQRAQDELRMIQQFEAEQRAVIIAPPEAGGETDALTEDEELRLIEEFEARQERSGATRTPKDPQ